LDVDGLHRTLTLRYRAQHRSRGKRPRDADRREDDAPTPTTVLSDEEKLAAAKAVEASFNTAPDAFTGTDIGLDRALGKGLDDPTTSYTLESYGSPPEDVQLQWALQDSLTRAIKAGSEQDDASPIATEQDSEPLPGDSASEAIKDQAEITVTAPDEPSSVMAADEVTPATSPEDGSESDSTEERIMSIAELNVEARIIGTKEFDIDDAFLDEHIKSVLEYWHGQRPPHGVDITLTNRCMPCEYREGCEWREQKARELKEIRAHRAAAQ